ncbi:helix-turn-helix domain-containing protein [Georgenia yuyongxinii]
MEERKRGNPAGPTNEHVAANLRRARQSSGVDLRELSARVAAAGRKISPSALSKIETGDRRVDVDDLATLAYALETTPAALLIPREGGTAPTGVPPGFVPEEVRSWMQGKVKFTTDDLVRYWTDEAHICQGYIFRFKELIRGRESMTPPSGRWVTPTDVLEDRLARQRERLAFISHRLLELDPMGAPIEETEIHGWE